MAKVSWDNISKDILKLYENAPVDAFPYKPPSTSEIQKYGEFFDYDVKPLEKRKCKRFFDILIGSVFLLISLPLLLILYIIYIFEMILIPSHRGPFLYFYHSVSHGKKIKKWKIRQVKWSSETREMSYTNDWIVFSTEWNQDELTFVGRIVKKFYLDELPQFWAIVKGDISLVGPRPLCTVHFLMDLENGNICRTLLPGGLLGLGHLNKGTAEMGLPSYEYEYLERYVKASCISLIWLDIKVLMKGFKVMIKGGGF